jgi:hypothetical protein
MKRKPDRLSKTEGPIGDPKQAVGGSKQATQEFADGDHVVYDGRDWKGAVSRPGKQWLAVTSAARALATSPTRRWRLRLYWTRLPIARRGGKP